MVIFHDALPLDEPAAQAPRQAAAMGADMQTLLTRWHRLDYELGFGAGVFLSHATFALVRFAVGLTYSLRVLAYWSRH